jgi:excisionase family DNA binding protein
MPSQKRDDDDLLTVAELAARWHLTIRTVHRYITTGKVKAIQLPGGQYRVRLGDAIAAEREL